MRYSDKFELTEEEIVIDDDLKKSLSPSTPYRMEKARQRVESPLAGAIEKLAATRLATQKKRLLSLLARKLTKADGDPISDKDLYDALADADFPDGLDGVYGKAVKEGGDLQAAQLRVGWREEDPDVQKFIRSRRSNLETVMDEATAKEVKRALAQGRLENETEKELIQRLEGLGIFGKARAQRIARTEAHLAVMTGSFEVAKQNGITHKQWLSSLDERTRETHLEANGQTVEIDEPFQVGDAEGMFPGDPELPPEENINCRCTLLYHRRNEDEPDLADELEINLEDEEDDDLEDIIRSAIRSLPKGQTIGIDPDDLDNLGIKRIRGKGASYDPDERVARIGPDAPRAQVQDVVREHIVASAVTPSDAAGFINQLRAAKLPEPSSGSDAA